MSGVATNRSNIDLPTIVSSEIIQKTQEASAVMQLSRQISLPGRGLTIPVITGDPTAAWVGETEKKPVSTPSLTTRVMRGYKLCVIEPFSNQFRRDDGALFDALIQRLPGVLAAKFDNTVFGGTAAPGDDFDTLASVTAHSITPSLETGCPAYMGITDAVTDIAMNGGDANGFVISPEGKGILLQSTDDNWRPLFINNIADNGIPRILGAPTYVSRGAYISGSPSAVGFVGDWTKAMYGIVEGVDIQFSSDASLELANGQTITLFQQNMFAVRCEIEVGFRCDTDVFKKLTASSVPSF